MAKNGNSAGKSPIVIIGAIAVIAVLFFCIGVLRDVFGLRGGGDYIVEIPDGAGTSRVSDILHKGRIIKHPMVFKMYVKLSDAPVYQKGRHVINASMSYSEIIKKLEDMPDADEEKEKRVVIPEGYELRQIVDLLVENGLGDKAAFMNEIENGSFNFDFISNIPKRENRLEGYLYPDTYMFSIDETEHDIINKMLTAFNEKVIPVFAETPSPYSLDQILTMASVIEREAANDDERPLVSSVFYNRIKEGMKFESCATVQYILKERKNILSNADIAIESPYNTYIHSGLPIGPIASPGLESVKAALKPAETNYLYFLATADGSKNLFSETFEEHTQKIKETQG